LITQGAPYRASWEKYRADHNLQNLIAAVSRSYATDPKYMAMVSTIAGQSNVARAIAAARQTGAINANA
jgi:flagellum-specific peptidoglycan hydrolase FlgJ